MEYAGEMEDDPRVESEYEVKQNDFETVEINVDIALLVSRRSYDRFKGK